MKYLLKNTLLLNGKTASSCKKLEEKDFYLQENDFISKLFALVSITVSKSIKKTAEQSILFLLDRKTENKFRLAGMRDSLKNTFSLDEKVTFSGYNI